MTTRYNSSEENCNASLPHEGKTSRSQVEMEEHHMDYLDLVRHKDPCPFRPFRNHPLEPQDYCCTSHHRTFPIPHKGRLHSLPCTYYSHTFHHYHTFLILHIRRMKNHTSQSYMSSYNSNQNHNLYKLSKISKLNTKRENPF